MRVGELFARSAASSVPLRLALFLRGFAAEPRLEVFTPTLETFGGSPRFALNNTLWVAWGTTPQLRLLQFVLFVRMLSRMRCAWLDVGDPEPTADLIEKTIVPQLREADERVDALRGVPRQDQWRIDGAREYLRLRSESWRLRAQGLLETQLAVRKTAKKTADPEVSLATRHRSSALMLGRAQDTQRAALDALDRVKA